MAYDGVVNDFRTIREKRTPARIPCVACSEEFDVKWYGKYDYETFCRDGDKMVEVIRAAVLEFDYDWAWLQIDDCFEFEPLGIHCPGQGNILRATHGTLEPTREVLDGLPQMDPLRDGRMPEKLKAIRKLRSDFGDSLLIVGSCAAPFSATGLMWGMEQPMFLMMDDPGLLRDAMEYWLAFYKRYMAAQRDAGAHAIWLGDCNAFSGLLSVEQYNEFIFDVTHQLVRFAETELDLMVWMHNSEISIPHIESHIPLGLSFESIGPAADLKAVRNTTRGRHAISGNLDPIEVLWRGTPQSIAGEVYRIMEIGRDGGGYIFNTGEMNPRDIPVENMKAMMKRAKELS
jgi:uroporphyrinogen-III decarboxylase